MQVSKLYHALVVLGASAAGTGLVACGEDDPGTGQQPVDGSGGVTGHGGSSATGGASNACAGKCNTASNGWVTCSGVCCWLNPGAPCCS